MTLGNRFLNDDWKINGTRLEDFKKAYDSISSATTLEIVSVNDLQLAYIDTYEHSSVFEGKLFVNGLEGPIYKIRLKKSQILSGGIDPSFLTEIRKNKDILYCSMKPYFTGVRAIGDIILMSSLGGSNLAFPCLERTALLSKCLPLAAGKDKAVTLVVRRGNGLRKIMAIRSTGFTPYGPSDMYTAIEMLPSAFNSNDWAVEWSIDHHFTTITILLNDFESYTRAWTGSKDDIIPILEIQDSMIGDSSFTIRTGLFADGNKIFLSEKTWGHGKRKSEEFIQAIVKTTADEFRAELKQLVESSFDNSTQISGCQNAESTRNTLFSILDFVEKECSFRTQLGKEMWESAKNRVVNNLCNMRIINGISVMKEIFKCCETKTLKNQKALADVPAAIAKWLQKMPADKPTADVMTGQLSLF